MGSSRKQRAIGMEGIKMIVNSEYKRMRLFLRNTHDAIRNISYIRNALCVMRNEMCENR